MKILKLLLVFPIIAFSFELEFNKKFSKVLPHDTLSAYITITISDEEEISVAERLEVFNEKVKMHDKVENELLSSNIRPKYKHSANTPRNSGFVGELRYKADSYKARHMRDFISEITSLKRNRDTSVSITSLSWTVKEDTYNVVLDLLRFEAITWGEEYSKRLSEDVKKNCSIKKIEMNTVDQFEKNVEQTVYTITSINNKSIPLQELNQELIKINPTYILECK